MDSDTNDDLRGRPDALSEGARRRRQLRLVLALAIAVFAVSLAFVLVYAAGLSWLPALLISVVLGTGQVYTLRRTLFRGRR